MCYLFAVAVYETSDEAKVGWLLAIGWAVNELMGFRTNHTPIAGWHGSMAIGSKAVLQRAVSSRRI